MTASPLRPRPDITPEDFVRAVWAVAAHQQSPFLILTNTVNSPDVLALFAAAPEPETGSPEGERMEIVATADTCFGSPRLAGTRLRLSMLIESAMAGDQLRNNWPHIGDGVERILKKVAAEMSAPDDPFEEDVARDRTPPETSVSPPVASPEQEEENERLRRAVVDMAIPYEALRMDAESRKWIAPSIWDHIVRATETARSSIRVTPSNSETSR